MWGQIIKHWSGCSNWRNQRVALPVGSKSCRLTRSVSNIGLARGMGMLTDFQDIRIFVTVSAQTQIILKACTVVLAQSVGKGSLEMQLMDMGEQLLVVWVAKANEDRKLLDINEEADKGLVSPTAVQIHPLAQVLQDMPGFLLLFVFLWHLLVSWGKGIPQKDNQMVVRQQDRRQKRGPFLQEDCCFQGLHWWRTAAFRARK